MSSLSLMMIAHGVPVSETVGLAELLRIESLEDLAELHFLFVMRVSYELRYALIALHNSHKRTHDDDWVVPNNVDCHDCDLCCCCNETPLT